MSADQRAEDTARICLSKVVLATNMERMRSMVRALLGLYEERAAERQYDILGDGGV